MHLFYTPDICDKVYTLAEEESKHCIKVLRLGIGDKISLVDGNGNFYTAVIIDNHPKRCVAQCVNVEREYGKRPFKLHIAIAPTKNIDRIEWMLEKSTEIGVDEFTMLCTVHSERKVVKDERLEKVIISAMKQSIKAYMPKLNSMIDFKRVVDSASEKYKFIAHCNPGEKSRIEDLYVYGEDVLILIGPEGDFSEEEVAYALDHDFKAITLGESRLRTETAGIVACHTINFLNKV